MAAPSRKHRRGDAQEELAATLQQHVRLGHMLGAGGDERQIVDGPHHQATLQVEGRCERHVIIGPGGGAVATGALGGIEGGVGVAEQA